MKFDIKIKLYPNSRLYESICDDARSQREHLLHVEYFDNNGRKKMYETFPF